MDDLDDIELIIPQHEVKHPKGTCATEDGVYCSSDCEEFDNQDYPETE